VRGKHGPVKAVVQRKGRFVYEVTVYDGHQVGRLAAYALGRSRAEALATRELRRYARYLRYYRDCEEIR
jgi:hypothetical protein